MKEMYGHYIIFKKNEMAPVFDEAGANQLYCSYICCVCFTADRLINLDNGEMWSQIFKAWFGNTDKAVIGSIYNLFCNSDRSVKIIFMSAYGIIKHKGIVRGEIWLIGPTARHKSTSGIWLI